MSTTGIIILAAGNSSRLGRPKQLLPFRGKTLLGHVVAEAVAADLQPVVVVTGAFHAEVSAALRGQPLDIVFNSAWKEGMASGIVAGLSSIISLQQEVEAVIISVCDQPFISSALLLELVVARGASGKGIVACTYADSVGTPVLFSRHYFEQLVELSGSEGAKKLVNLYADDVATVDFPEGHIDIDTEEDTQFL